MEKHWVVVYWENGCVSNSVPRLIGKFVNYSDASGYRAMLETYDRGKGKHPFGYVLMMETPEILVRSDGAVVG